MRLALLAPWGLAACSLYFGDADHGNHVPPHDGGTGSGAALLVAGSRSTCARVGGNWWCWGANYADQLTDMPGWDPRPKVSPEQIAPPAIQLAIGRAHSCDVEADGSINCWGSNWTGQLGRVTDLPNVNAEQNLPAAVAGLPRPGLTVAAGGGHTCALLTDHSVWCWGDNSHGQLGVEVSSGPTPRHVMNGVAQIVLGDDHSCAVKQDHTLWCWGSNADGQLGDGTMIDRPAPTLVAATPTALALGRAHTCALDASHAVTCWGANARGQLGDGTTSSQAAPGASVLADAVAIVAHGDHACAVRSDGSAACWGDNDDGELGDGTVVERDAPTPVAITGTLAALALGDHHACALRADGTLACWGRDSLGELGDGAALPPGPQSAMLPAGASALAVGAFHACVIAGSDARVYCWGDDHHGQLGDGAPAPVSALPVDTGLTGVVTIAAGVAHTCAVRGDHSLWCWGDNSDGELGDGTHDAHAHPTMTSATATAVAAGDGFTCAIAQDHSLRCFGRSDLGQLATGAMLPPLSSISASYDHACAVTTAGAALCWGSNAHGQVGNGGAAVMAAPAGPAGTFQQIATGGRHTCAVLGPSMAPVCWGGNDLLQLGSGFNLTDSYVPTRASVDYVVGSVAVGAGRAHTCVSSTDTTGNLWTECFGEDIDGQCGVASRHINFPMLLATPSLATTIGGGDAFTCILVGQGVQCWGDNSRGQLGLGMYSRVTTPLELVIPAS